MTAARTSSQFTANLRRAWPLLMVIASFAAWWTWTKGADFRQRHIIGADHAGRGPLVILGDELTQGAGASQGELGFAGLLGKSLQREVIAVATPGETSELALTKLADVVAKKPGVVIVALGQGDLEQRLPLDRTTAALRQIFASLQKQGAMVVYVGASLPDVGDNWIMALEQLCKEAGVLFVGDVLKDLRRDPGALDTSGKLPTDLGHEKIAARIASALKPYL